jgi:hypothetical protein
VGEANCVGRGGKTRHQGTLVIAPKAERLRTRPLAAEPRLIVSGVSVKLRKNPIAPIGAMCRSIGQRRNFDVQCATPTAPTSPRTVPAMDWKVKGYSGWIPNATYSPTRPPDGGSGPYGRIRRHVRKTESTRAGEQHVIPGEKVSDAEIAKRRARALLKPKVGQKPADEGRDGANQADLIDLAGRPNPAKS